MARSDERAIPCPDTEAGSGARTGTRRAGLTIPEMTEAEYKKRWAAVKTTADVESLVRDLIVAAQSGELWAAKIIFQDLFGPP